jgi:hypothetical protein
MFDNLLTINPSVALVAVYDVLQTLFASYRKQGKPGKPDTQALQERLSNPVAELEERERVDAIVLETLNEIRTVAQKDLSDLTEEEISAYTKQLTRVVQARIQSVQGYDAELGKNLLARMRSAYP